MNFDRLFINLQVSAILIEDEGRLEAAGKPGGGADETSVLVALVALVALVLVGEVPRKAKYDCPKVGCSGSAVLLLGRAGGAPKTEG